MINTTVSDWVLATIFYTLWRCRSGGSREKGGRV